MSRVEKTIFLSYRRTNIPWALAIYQNLTQHGFDVFFDYTGVASGDFEQVILGSIGARAHFLVLLTPSALERCGEPGDWLRREIETAIQLKRNIVPMMLEGFSFHTPTIANQLTGSLEALKKYNGLTVPAEYFEAAMQKLRDKFLNVALEAVLHPASTVVRQIATEQKAAAQAVPQVREKELTAQEWYEKGYKAASDDEKIACYSEAIGLKPDYAIAFLGRGNARDRKGEPDTAISDFNEAIRLKPDFAVPFNNRGILLWNKGDTDGAICDYDEAIRLKPDYAEAFNNRAVALQKKGDLAGAICDYTEAIRLNPAYAKAYYNRSLALAKKGDHAGAKQDRDEALRLGYKP